MLGSSHNLPLLAPRFPALLGSCPLRGLVLPSLLREGLRPLLAPLPAGLSQGSPRTADLGGGAGAPRGVASLLSSGPGSP